eukprot:COSAG04_NODE_1699_length_5892_cov_3.353530_9_plen_203_part_01
MARAITRFGTDIGLSSLVLWSVRRSAPVAAHVTNPKRIAPRGSLRGNFDPTQPVVFSCAARCESDKQPCGQGRYTVWYGHGPELIGALVLPEVCTRGGPQSFSNKHRVAQSHPSRACRHPQQPVRSPAHSHCCTRVRGGWLSRCSTAPPTTPPQNSRPPPLTSTHTPYSPPPPPPPAPPPPPPPPPRPPPAPPRGRPGPPPPP